MALVPQELLSTIQAKQQEEMTPMVKQVLGIDSEMKTIMSRQDLPEDEKAALYQQLLQRYLTYRDKRRAEPVSVRLVTSNPASATAEVTTTDVETTTSPGTVSTNGKEDHAILEAFPKSMKARARQLLNIIKHKGGDVLDYNQHGELLYNKQVVPGSQISDLIRDVIQRRKDFNPAGWQSFSRGLAQINTPEAPIRHPTRLAVIQHHKTRAALGDSLSNEGEDDDDIVPTPLPKRRRVSKRIPANKAKVLIPNPTAASSSKQSFMESSWK
ncbi:Hypp6080 [Branchiostoma lanceolatum]|uniref:Hypp6080 protein n=1 Tax=Branchiostoma lanceolatum TaxID=7740 RepID=A0A8J9VI02_BRALA|nr:Hypp6080 [Branchiostoma lanceolatum]